MEDIPKKIIERKREIIHITEIERIEFGTQGPRRRGFTIRRFGFIVLCFVVAIALLTVIGIVCILAVNDPTKLTQIIELIQNSIRSIGSSMNAGIT